MLQFAADSDLINLFSQVIIWLYHTFFFGSAARQQHNERPRRRRGDLRWNVNEASQEGLASCEQRGPAVAPNAVTMPACFFAGCPVDFKHFVCVCVQFSAYVHNLQIFIEILQHRCGFTDLEAWVRLLSCVDSCLRVMMCYSLMSPNSFTSSSLVNRQNSRLVMK